MSLAQCLNRVFRTKLSALDDNAAENLDVVLFSIYGKVGGRTDAEAAAVTDTVLQAIEEDMAMICEMWKQ